MIRRILIAVAALLAVALVGGATGAALWEATDDDAPAPAATPAAGTPASSSTSSVADLYRRVSPGVVEIRAGSAEGEATGSAWVLDDQGHLVTNQHVVAGADTVTVRFADGDEATARVVGTDPSTDVALLELENSNHALTPLPLGSSKALHVGDTAIAIGSPFGLQGTLTVGVVSGLNRELSAPDGFAIEGAIQTDAALNPGNSGGPLLDNRGRVVGMNSQIRTDSGSNSGIGYAISIETIRSVVDQLLKGGTVEHAYLGVRVGDADSGARLVDVVSGGPAERAGLRVDDVVVRAGDEEVTSAADVRRIVAAGKPGEKLELEVRRDGQTRTFEVELGTRPSAVD
jgi:putative serine protease PepD